MPRHKNDFYQTPLAAIDSLLHAVNTIRAPFLDLGCGSGAIGNHILATGAYSPRMMTPCTGIDLDKYDSCKFPVIVQDVLENPHLPDCQTVVMNPPYKQAEAFVWLAMTAAPLVHALLRLNFLGGQARHENKIWNHLAEIYVLNHRPSFTGDGKTDGTEYAWFTFTRQERDGSFRGRVV